MNMQDVKVPGVLWIALVVAALAVLRHYVTDPLYVEIGIVVAFALLKSLNLGTAELEELLAIIARLQAQIDKDRPRSAEAAPLVPTGKVEAPNKFVRWLVG